MLKRFFAVLAAVLAIAIAVPLTSLWAAQASSVTVQVVDQRGMPVRDAVVELDPDGGWKGPIKFPWRQAMAQKNQTFVPGTLIVARGTSVAFPNLDTVRHSIYSFSKPARFEIDLYGRDQSRRQDFPVAGSVALGCNIHDQMRGYIRVVDTPYTGKTDQNGILRLGAVPKGGYRMTVWHPRARLPNGELHTAYTVSNGARSDKVVLKIR